MMDDNFEKIAVMLRRKIPELSKIEEIGQGNFGKVFKIKINNNPQYYAIKYITTGSSQNKNLEYFERELNIMKCLTNKNIVKYCDSWIEPGQSVFIKMEYCDLSLKEIILQKSRLFPRTTYQTIHPLNFIICSDIFKGILEGVKYLHEFNPPIIHRDLKPINILIKLDDMRSFVKICDFGLAKFQEKESMYHTQGLGTLGHIAPEVMAGKKYNTKADIYSLGILVQELYGMYS